MKRLTLVCTTVLFATATSSLLAETAIHHDAFSITAFGSYFNFSNKRHLKSGGGVGLGAAYYFNRNWAAELDFTQFESEQKRAPDKDVNGQYVTLNGLYYFRAGQALRPYVSASVGAVHFSRTDLTNEPGTQANLGVGGGLTYFFEPKIALRVGANDYYNTTGSGYNDIAAHAGFSFYFGGNSSSSQSDSTMPEADYVTKHRFADQSKQPDKSAKNVQSSVKKKHRFAKPEKQTQAKEKSDYSLYD